MIDTINTLFWANVLLTFFLVIGLAHKVYVAWRMRRKETFGFMIDGEKKIRKTIKVDTRKQFFEYDKGSYNVSEPYIKYGRKHFLLYLIGNPDAIDITGNKARPVFPVDVYHDMMKNELAKALNRGNLFGGLNMRTLMIIGGIALAAFIALQYL